MNLHSTQHHDSNIGENFKWSYLIEKLPYLKKVIVFLKKIDKDMEVTFPMEEMVQFVGTEALDNMGAFSKFHMVASGLTNLTIEQIIQHGDGLFILKDKILYFSTVNNTNPIINDKIF